MIKISSDSRFYRGFFGLIIGPILIVLFVENIMSDNVSNYFKNSVYCLFLILIMTQIRLVFKSRRIFYDNKTLFLENYFTKKTEKVLATNVISLKKAFSLHKKRNRKLLKIIYLKDNKKQTIYFYRSSEFVTINDLEVLIGSKL
ncbi:hypothetical protein LT679_15820 [Mucilaginibacter roseus]|uniref:Uncharacterized protein n=1 Tax=Mucilaginibacter roseus TaxID=1528868 RepID=A0ABS8U818_9SPHI|nr:hypothetical protein [Mucilaginibacter roseus]MCD8742082.1 hypothetical protein [Mucilaginibacter roseus]